MARLLDDAASHYLLVDSVPLTAAPLTMACWFKSDDQTKFQTLIFLGEAAESGGTNRDQFRLAASGNAAGDPVNALTGDAGAASSVSSTSGYTAGVWHHACGVFGSATSRIAYIDGGSSATETTSRVPTVVDRLAVGRRANAVADQAYYSGDIAEIAIWDVALSASEVASLAGGLSPLSVNVANLVFYAPLYGDDSPEPDLIGGLNLTVSGATKSAHPFIYHPGSAAFTSFNSLNAKDSPPFKGDKSFSQLKGRNPTYVDRSRQLRGITIEYGGEK